MDERWRTLSNSLEHLIRYTARTDPIVQTMCKDETSARHVGDRLYEMIREVITSEQEKTIKKLTALVEQLKLEKTKLTNSIVEDLHNTIVAERQAHSVTLSQREKLKSVCESLSKEMNKVVDDLQEAQQATSQESRETISVLQKQLRDAEKESSQAKHELKAQQDRNQQLLSKLDESRKSLSKLEEGSRQQLRMAKTFEESLKELQLTLSTRTRELTIVNDECTKLRETLQVTRKELDSSLAEKMRFELMANELSIRSAHHAHQKNTNDELMHMHQELEGRKQQIAVLQNQVNQTRMELDTTLRHAEEIRRSHESLGHRLHQETILRASAEEREKQLKEQTTSLSERISQLITQRQEKEREVLEALARARFAETSSQQLESLKGAHGQQVEEYTKSMNSLKDQIRALNDEKDSLRKQFENERQVMVQQISSLSASLDAERVHKLSLESQLQEVRYDLANAKDKIQHESSLRRQSEKVRREYERCDTMGDVHIPPTYGPAAVLYRQLHQETEQHLRARVEVEELSSRVRLLRQYS
eukprot:PhF_6_TR38177/c0_g2_i1/m.57072